MSYAFYCACNGKRRLTYAEAVSTAKRIRRQRDSQVTEYRCLDCEWWHVGNRPEHDHAVTVGVR